MLDAPTPRASAKTLGMSTTTDKPQAFAFVQDNKAHGLLCSILVKRRLGAIMEDFLAMSSTSHSELSLNLTSKARDSSHSLRLR
jgi:hypothetical protein